MISVQDLTKSDFIDRELILIKIISTLATEHKITQLVNKYQTKILDINPEYITIEATADKKHIDELLGYLKTFGIKEMVRTGRVAMSKNSGKEYK